MATSAPRQQEGHSICHEGGFRQWVDGRDYFKHGFLFLRKKFAKKSILGLKWELTQNVGTKSVFSPKLYSGSRNKRKNLLQEKKNYVKFCSIMSRGPCGDTIVPITTRHISKLCHLLYHFMWHKTYSFFWGFCPFLSTTRERWTYFYLEYLRQIQSFTDFKGSFLAS